MFAKNKPVVRVTLEDGNWVDLQHLSKGVKDSFKNSLSGLTNGGLEISLDDGGDGANPKPKSISLSDNFLEKINDVNYRKMAAAIREWSAKDEEGKPVPVTEAAVKELDEAVFDRIMEEINKMNELSTAEEKNLPGR